MPKAGHGIVISRFPMLLHGPPRELIVLGYSFVAFAAVNQVNKVADSVIGLLLEQLEIRVAFHFFGKSFEEICCGSAKLLLVFVPIGALTRAARKTNLF